MGGAHFPCHFTCGVTCAATPGLPSAGFPCPGFPGRASVRRQWRRAPDGLQFPSRHAGDIPLVSVLRDSLGDNDPNNDRLRYIWVLTSARPTLLQHAAAFVPFFYWQPDLGKNPNRKPAAILDLGDTSKVVWSALAQSLVQSAAIDSNGALSARLHAVIAQILPTNGR